VAPSNKLRAIHTAKAIAKSGGGSAGMLPHPASIAFRHLEKRGDAESFAVGGPASARALQLARVTRPYQIPNELGHVPTELGDYPWRQPYWKASDEQARGGRSYDDGGDGGDVGDTGDAQNPDKNLQADLEPGTIDTYVLRNISRMIHVF
jgi:hypothetical protein